jgi:hypothetical protein
MPGCRPFRGSGLLAPAVVAAVAFVPFSSRAESTLGEPPLRHSSMAGERVRIEFDTGQLRGPDRLQLVLAVGDLPRRVIWSETDELCVQVRPRSRGLEVAVRAATSGGAENAVVTVSGPGVTPGTFRTTPAGLLVRLVEGADAFGWPKVDAVKPFAVCEL